MNLRLIIGFCVSLILHIALFVSVYILFKEDDRIAKLSTHTKTVVLAMNVVKPTPNAPPAPITSPPKPPAPVEPEKPAEKKPEPPPKPKKPKKPKKKVVKKKVLPKKKIIPKPIEPTPPPVERVEPTPVVTAPPVAPPSAPVSNGPTTTSAPYSPNPVPPGAIVGTTPQTAGVRSLKGTVTYRFVIGQSGISGQSGGGQRLNCGGRKPDYPKKAQRRNIEGTVKISFTADNSGRITKANITKASHPFLNDRKILKFLRRHCQIPN